MNKKNLAVMLAACLLFSSAFGQASPAPEAKQITKRENFHSVSPVPVAKEVFKKRPR